MARTVFAVQKMHSFDGHLIRVQKTSLVYKMQYGLVIDGVKQDQIEGLYGTFSLHGVMDVGNSTVPVEIIIKQGILAGTYYCRVAGVTSRMRNWSFESI